MIVFGVITELPGWGVDKLDGTLPATNTTSTIIYKKLETPSASNDWKGKVIIDPSLLQSHVVETFQVGEILVIDTEDYREVGRGRKPSLHMGVRYEVHETVEEAVRRSREVSPS